MASFFDSTVWSQNDMIKPNFDQDFFLPIMATLCWLFVFQLFTGMQAMTGACVCPLPSFFV